MKDWDDRDDSAPEDECVPAPYAPFPPYPPYPPYAPFPPYPPYPPCAPCQPCPQAAEPAEMPPCEAEESAPCEPPPEPGEGDGGSQGSPQPIPEPVPEPPLVFPSVVEVRRPDDLLVCTLRFVGFAFFRDPPRLQRAADDAYVSVEFPPQSFGEEAFLQVSGQSAATPDPAQDVEVSKDPNYPKQNIPGTDEPVPSSLPAARIRLAGSSRLVLAMPAARDSLDFTLAAILTALRDWPMRLAPTAVMDLTPIVAGPQAPGQNITSLELPYRLLISPLNPATWRHSIAPVTSSGRTELWHTRLANPVNPDQIEPPSRIRAIWSPDYFPPPLLGNLYKLMSTPNPPLIRMSLDPADRAMLVTLMSGFDAKSGSNPYIPISSEAKRLHLTSLGGLLDAEGSWNPDTLPDGIDLEQWRHLATLGRDQYVRVVYAGWLCPFGHAASLVKVTERRFQTLATDPSKRIAVLRQRFFLVVRQPVVTYTGANHVNAGRNFPFSQVELLTRVTPDVTDPGVGASAVKAASGGDIYKQMSILPRELFWPMVAAGNSDGMVDFPFHIAATDIAGNRITFALPLLFVGKPANDYATKNESSIVRDAYNASSKRKATIGGTNITYATVNSTDQGNPSTFPTSDITFWSGALKTTANPYFYPEVKLATIGVKPVQKLLAKPNFTTEVSYPDLYNANGFDAGTNPGQVFLQFTNALPLQFGGALDQAKSDALGALATPQMNLIGLSTIAGAVSGQDPAALANLAAGQFNPADFFKDATILGGINLGNIVKAATSLAGADVPKLVSRDLPDHVEASFNWSTTVTQADSANLIIPNADPGEGDTQLTMSGVVNTPLDPAKTATYEATAELNNFKVNLFGFIILWFEDMKFNARNGQKPDVTIQMREGQDAVTFGGPLEFVNTLRQYIPSNGFSDPPSLIVTPSGISASYSLTLPALEVGVFALSNVGLGAAFSLPFDGTPAEVDFEFSTREHPFSLTISLLGGGGFLMIGVTSNGVKQIEAAIEAGGVAAIDLGVASGSVEIKFGIYFHWKGSPDDSVELAGYFRMHGEVCVLSLISISITFYLQLGYIKDEANNKATVYGEAELTVEIDILMFSQSVSIHCRREFSGGPADPKFIDQIPTQQIWSEYCDAFAAEAA